MKDWKIRLEEKLKKSVVELTGIIRYVIYKMIILTLTLVILSFFEQKCLIF